MASQIYVILFLCAVKWYSRVSALDNGLALTPPMGWLAWERFRCNVDCKNDPHNCISETLFMEIAERMAADGYKDAGYEYVILDDCWMNKSRDAQGRLIPDPERFPNGIKFLADFIHSKGLKFGIYEDIGTNTCGGYPGIQGHEKQDIQTFADWGVDYVKLDGCYQDSSEFNMTYPEVGKYMNETGRPMVYSCSWPAYETGTNMTVPWEQIRDTCNLWRNYDDIQDSLASMTEIVEWFAQNQAALVKIAGPGAWNDPDMLLLGNFGLSYEQSKAQLALWSMLAAPLIMSNDLRHIRHDIRKILLNKNVIAVNQDKLGIQGMQIFSSQAKSVEVWARPVEPTAVINNKTSYSFAVVVWNKRDDGTPYPWSQSLQTYGLTEPSGYFVRDLFSNKDYGYFRPADIISFKINPSGVMMFKAQLAAGTGTDFKRNISPKKLIGPKRNVIME